MTYYACPCCGAELEFGLVQTARDRDETDVHDRAAWDDRVQASLLREATRAEP